MSRLFNGGVAADRIVCSRGNAPPDQGPITIAALVRPTAVASMWAVNADDATFARWAILVSSQKLFMENDFGTGGPTYTVGDWYWMVGTKASGSVPPRWHVKDVTTGGAWTHVDGSANVGDLTGVATEIIIGGQFTGGLTTTWRGQIAAVAAWSSVLGDAAVEAACTLAAADLLAAAPSWMVRLNQASTATPVVDDTGGGGDQVSISGTAVDASEPPGWSYALTTGVTPAGLAIPVSLGSPAVALAGATPNGLAIPITLGPPAVALNRAAAPNGLAVPVGLGVIGGSQLEPGILTPSGRPAGVLTPGGTTPTLTASGRP